MARSEFEEAADKFQFVGFSSKTKVQAAKMQMENRNDIPETKGRKDIPVTLPGPSNASTVLDGIKIYTIYVLKQVSSVIPRHLLQP